MDVAARACILEELADFMSVPGIQELGEATASAF